MNDQTITIQKLKEKIAKFTAERDWNQFHDAKSLSIAISAEAAELMEHFMWLDKNQLNQKISQNKQEIENEIADIIYMTVCFCNAYNIDLATAISQKMEINAKKYPIEKAKGNALKYTEF